MLQDLHTLPSHDELYKRAAAWIAEYIRAVLSRKGNALVGLSGGKTPRPVYELLGNDTSIDWSNVTVFLIDERYVSDEDDDSNTKLIRSSLLRSNTPGSAATFIAPDTSAALAQAVDDYSKSVLDAIREHSGIDLLVLGIGSDGHIASLFPPLHRDAMYDEGMIHTTTDQFAVHDRMTLTLPTLNEARESVLMFTGDEKKAAWDAMKASGEYAERWPLKALTHPVHALWAA